MASQPSLKTSAIHILPNINQTIKFGQLIEYNKRHILIRKSCWRTRLED